MLSAAMKVPSVVFALLEKLDAPRALTSIFVARSHS
jgi:hypothetical protein